MYYYKTLTQHMNCIINVLKNKIKHTEHNSALLRFRFLLVGTLVHFGQLPLCKFIRTKRINRKYVYSMFSPIVIILAFKCIDEPYSIHEMCVTI